MARRGGLGLPWLPVTGYGLRIGRRAWSAAQFPSLAGGFRVDYAHPRAALGCTFVCRPHREDVGLALTEAR